MGIYILLSKEASFEDLFGKIPSVFFKFLGLGVAVQALGGMLAGIYGQEGRFVGANQGAFIAAIDVGRFLPLDEFKRHVDRFMASARNMKPFPGYERAELAGSLEWQLEREYARKGIPLSPDHRKALDACAKELNVERLVTSNQ
jgi:LDH2 family malate/lactate/ureidoglycolate dehydrogenase